GDIWYWSGTVAVKDFLQEGNTLGLIFGQPPKLASARGAGVTADTGTSYHLEGLYKMKISDNILFTPGLLVIFNPENNNTNKTEYVGTLRTTFSF
ncbi:MAG: iron uptake porin, partial [Cuspidothrix sp.]